MMVIGLERGVVKLDDHKDGVRTHNMQVVLIDSPQWQNHINFRDYLNAFPKKAVEYEKLKEELAKQNPKDVSEYSNGKEAFIEQSLVEARIYL